MRDHGKLLVDHGIAVLHRPADSGWCIVRANGSTMLSANPPWTHEEAWNEVETLTGKSWKTGVVRLARHPDAP